MGTICCNKEASNIVAYSGDTMVAAQRSGIGHLGIDCPCILQDGSDDMARALVASL